MFRFATSEDLQPRSYCAFVPCSTTVTVTGQVGAAAEGEGGGRDLLAAPVRLLHLGETRMSLSLARCCRQEGGEAFMEDLRWER